MDIARPSNARQKRIRRIAYGAIALLAVLLITLGLSRLKPAAPGVERATVWIDTVKRGPLLREVRGLGTLVPEDIRWIPATTQGRVERILLHPGTAVTADSVILELINPQLDQELQDAELKVQAAEAALQNLRVQVQNDYLQQKAVAASIAAEYNKAQMQAEMNEALAKGQLVSALALRQSKMDADQLAIRDDIAQQQLASYEESIKARLAVQQSEVDQARAVLQLKQRQRDELKVRAGLDGILQLVPVEVGQQVAPGTNLARVANPGRLKAEIKIAETQAERHSDRSEGHHRHAQRPHRGHRGPHRSLGAERHDHGRRRTGRRSAERRRPGPQRRRHHRARTCWTSSTSAGRRSGRNRARSGCSSFNPTATATRVQVKLGRSSVNAVEVLSGLNVGDQVVLSDMSAWDAFDRVRLQ